MKIDAYKIRDIEVNETWVNGKQVFKKQWRFLHLSW
jgi:predicted amidohydrolase YtcJ